jgi:D-alanine-D-alanine ligase-like ATP-grasp enzyme
MGPHVESRLSRKLRIAVLSGGPSAERLISLKSGSAVARALAEYGHSVSEIDPAVVDVSAFDWGPFDVAFIALHGKFGEDGQIQQILESALIPYTGSGVAASRLAFSKSKARRFITVSPRTSNTSRSVLTRNGSERMVRAFSVTSSPILPSPRVTA